MEQTHAPQPQRRDDETALAEEVKQSEHAKEARKGLSDVDDLLDEIDELLGTEETEFATSYVQKGGQ